MSRAERIKSLKLEFDKLTAEEKEEKDNIPRFCDTCKQNRPSKTIHYCAAAHTVCDTCLGTFGCKMKKCDIFFYRSSPCKSLMCPNPSHSMVINGQTYCVSHGQHYKKYGPDSP